MSENQGLALCDCIHFVYDFVEVEVTVVAVLYVVKMTSKLYGIFDCMVQLKIE